MEKYLGKFVIFDMLPLVEQATQLAINNIHGIWSLGTAPGHMEAVGRILRSVTEGAQLHKIVSSSRYLPEDLVAECWKTLIDRRFRSIVAVEPLVPSPARTWYDVWIHYEETDKVAKEAASERLRDRMSELKKESEHSAVQVVRVGSVKAQNKTTNYGPRQPWGVYSRPGQGWDEAKPKVSAPQTKGSKVMQKFRKEARSMQRSKDIASSKSTFRSAVSAPKVPVGTLTLPPQPYRPASKSRPATGDFMLPAAGSSRSVSSSRPLSSGLSSGASVSRLSQAAPGAKHTGSSRPASGILSRPPPFSSGKRKLDESSETSPAKRNRSEPRPSPRASSSPFSSTSTPPQRFTQLPLPTLPLSPVSGPASTVSSGQSSPSSQSKQTSDPAPRPRQRPMTIREKMMASSRAREMAKSQKPAPGGST